MSKRKERRSRKELFERVMAISTESHAPQEDDDEKDNASHDGVPVADTVLADSPLLRGVLMLPGVKRELTKMKKFRFQLLHQWMQDSIAPCRVADIGGGKGLLAYLLNQTGWDATTIDPVHQELPTKYKDLASGRQMRIAETESVPRHDSVFVPEMAQNHDLLVAMHAHGCNVQIIDAAARYGRSVVLLPCCIIDEPLRPAEGDHWLHCVAEYASSKGFQIEPFRLNFKGQNIGLYLHR